MSEIIDSVYECIRDSGHERGILFLDEINCVSETLYPSMLQFLQFKTFGRHAIPDGWVVITAGNPPEYNRSVHEFDIVTLDRVKKIPVEPDLAAWKAYALSKGVHPCVMTFLETKKDRFYSIKTTLDGKEFVTARGWDDLSDIMRTYERLGKKVDGELIAHYVQDPKIAGEFAAYYELFNKYRDDYKVEKILSGDVDKDVIERAKGAEFDERLSLLGLILDSIEPDLRELMGRTDVLLAVRDDLRRIKSDLAEGSGSDSVSGEAPDIVPAVLSAIVEDRIAAREALALSGNLNRSKKRIFDDEIAMLAKFQLELGRGSGDRFEDMSALESMFSEQAQLDGRVAEQEAKLANAFEFIEEAFGDAQEMLIFVTELTQRTPSARYIAQFGSESYFSHNQQMILSDSQKKLREMVEDLEL